MKKKKIFLLGATFNTDNMGVGALAAGALTILTKKYADADIFFLDYGKESLVTKIDVAGKIISVPLVNLRFSWKIFLPNNVAYLFFMAIFIKFIGQSLGKRLINKNRWLKVISEADIAVAVSGGDSFSDIYGLSRFFYVVLPQLLITIMGKQLIFLPQTIGPLKGGLSGAIAKFLMRRAEIIYSRDIEGVREAKFLLNLIDDDTKVRFCYDMGFVVEPHRPNHIDFLGISEKELALSSSPLIGLNVSGLLLLGGYNKRNMFNLKVDYQTLIDEIIKFLIETYHVNILLVPHVFGGQEESDSYAVSAIYERIKDSYLDRLFCVSGLYDQNEIKYIIGRCDFFIGSRMHACIAALSQSIPAIAISYSRKFVGVFESIGVEYLIADPRQLTIEETLNIIGRALRERAEIKNHLQRTIPEVKEKILTLLNEIE
ncbi:MAG: polysaccharide pyruvyl transferase family protein [Methylobacter sp.]|nr:polysaccharide pyruvyl transferase family protein [Methylobacter sp.]